MVFNSNNQGIAKEINACLLLFTLNKKWMVHSYKLLVNRKIYSFCTNQMTKVFMEKNLRNPKGHFHSLPIPFLSNIFAVRTRLIQLHFHQIFLQYIHKHYLDIKRKNVKKIP